MNLHRILALVLCAMLLLLAAGCSVAPPSEQERASLETRASATLRRLQDTDPGVDAKFVKSAKGYAVFPGIAKGAVGLGGAFGHGVLYENGSPVGYCSVAQGTIGLQLGGQAYSEVVFFEDAKTLQDFKDGTMEFAAQASAVAAAAGASADADYDQGVAVFVLGEKGLMYEAAIGGQKFSYLGKVKR